MAQSPFLKSTSLISTKVYPTVDSQNAKIVVALGNVCSAAGQLPTSTLLSTGLDKWDDTPVMSGGFSEVLRGFHHDREVIIKSYRMYQHLERAKEVSIQPTSKTCFRTEFRFCGNECPCGRDYLTKTFCRFAAST